MKVKTEKKVEEITEATEKIDEKKTGPILMREEKKEVWVKPSKKGRGFFGGLYHFLKHLLIVIEKILKITALFAITITGSIFLLVASFYLFSSVFGLKESPAFQALRDPVGTLSAIKIEEMIQKIEKNKDWQWKGNFEPLKGTNGTEEKLLDAVVDLQELKAKEQEVNLQDLKDKIRDAEDTLQKKTEELRQIENTPPKAPEVQTTEPQN